MPKILPIVKKTYDKIHSSKISSSLTNKETHKWVAFEENRHKNGSVVRKDLIKFIDKHGKEIETATEIGCGGFVESLYLAQHGIKVNGIDGVINRDLLDSLLNNPNVSEETKNNLTISEQNFANLNLEKSDLICSFASLPFCPKDKFGNMLSNIVNAVNPNGYLLLHFFGENHPFVTQGGLTGFNSQQLEDIFTQLGFQTNTYEFLSEQAANGKRLPNMENIVITAQAPEQPLYYTEEQINSILGFQPSYQINSDFEQVAESPPIDNNTISNLNEHTITEMNSDIITEQNISQ